MKTKILIVVRGGVVQRIDCTRDCECYVLDFDATQGKKMLLDSEGREQDGELFQFPIDIDSKTVNHYVAQIKGDLQ